MDSIPYEGCNLFICSFISCCIGTFPNQNFYAADRHLETTFQNEENNFFCMKKQTRAVFFISLNTRDHMLSLDKQYKHLQQYTYKCGND